jgi:hypothetical protein
VEYEKDKNQLEMNIAGLREETLFLKMFFLCDYQYVDHVNYQVKQLTEEIDFYQVLF